MSSIEIAVSALYFIHYAKAIELFKNVRIITPTKSKNGSSVWLNNTSTLKVAPLIIFWSDSILLGVLSP